MSNEMGMGHSDCRNFCSMDVAKGLCRRTHELVLIDSEACAHFVQLPKCEFCAHYAGGSDHIGVCKAEKGEPWAYPDMIAVTCEMFASR
jgi:4-hydroxyphenylacetate decarboxylase small subunit